MEDLKVFEELKSTNSIVEKEKILSKYKDSVIVKELFEAALHPYKLYQFNSMPCKFESQIQEPTWTFKDKHDCFMALLKDLDGRHTTGNLAKETVSGVMRFFDKDQFDIYSKILLKAPLGVTARTVNKVWPNLIPEFKLMLAPNDLADVTKLVYPVGVQPKLDGYRCVYIRQSLVSRAGKPFGNKHLPEYFDKLFTIKNTVADGELYCDGLNFNQLQTILNTYDLPLPKGLKFVIYDAMDVADWDAKKCKKPYKDRLSLVNTLVANISDYKKVTAIVNDTAKIPQEVVALYKNHLQNGYEGAMVKDPEGLYRWKRVTLRSGEMLKLKPFETKDLVVTDIYAGQGKNEGVAGGMVVDHSGTAVRVGTGLNDDLREALAADPSQYIGKTAEIRFFEVTEDNSLRHPSFVRWREDKD